MQFLKNRKAAVVIGVLAALIVLRAFLPLIIKNYLNDYLANDVENYTGHIEDFDLSLWRGAYQIEGLVLKKKNVKEKTPFIEVKELDISLSWKALFRGKFLIDLKVDSSRINFTDSKKKEERQFGVDNKAETWSNLFNKLVPFNLESLVVGNGEIHFQNNALKAPVDLYIKKVELNAKNIHNSMKEGKKLFSEYKLTAVAQDHADIKSKGTFNLLVDPMDFDMSLELKKFKLTELNVFLKEYIPLDITSGELFFFMEMASYKGVLKGYLKPMLKNMDVIAGELEEDDSFKEFLLEMVTALSNVILQNSKDKTFATKVPIEGKMESPRVDVWKAIKVAFAHGFGRPEVKPKVDEEINLKSAIEQKKKEK